MTFESANANLYAAIFMLCLGLVLLGCLGLVLAKWMQVARPPWLKEDEL